MKTVPNSNRKKVKKVRVVYDAIARRARKVYQKLDDIGRDLCSAVGQY